VTAAKIAFLRSINKLTLRYDSLFCNGDAKTISKLNNCEVYGLNFTIEKEECIGHVGKRLGKQLLIVHSR